MIKKLLFVIIVFVQFNNNSLKAQSSLTFDGSQVFSTFKFTDSKGNLDKSYKSLSSGAYSLGFRYIHKTGLYFRTNLGVRHGGASLDYQGNNYQWNMQYLDAKIGVGYLLNKWRFKPYFFASPYFAYMLSAKQTMNGTNFDLKSASDFKTKDVGLIFSPGFKVNLSDYISVYMDYNYLMGLQNIEASGNQKLLNRASYVSIGVAATITQITPKWVQETK